MEGLLTIQDVSIKILISFLVNGNEFAGNIWHVFAEAYIRWGCMVHSHFKAKLVPLKCLLVKSEISLALRMVLF